MIESKERIMQKRTYGEGQCSICGQIFTKNAPNQLKCEDCRKPKPGKKKYKSKKCKVCGEIFQPASPTQKYCPACKIHVDRERDYAIKRRNSNGIEPRACEMCGDTYQPTGNTQKYCENCRDSARKARQKAYNQKHRKGYNQKGENNNNWKGGIGVYRNLAFTEYNMDKRCNRCDSTKFICIHHKDRNRNNNSKDNLEVLCKSCHQIEHQAGKNLHPDSPKFNKEK